MPCRSPFPGKHNATPRGAQHHLPRVAKGKQVKQLINLGLGAPELPLSRGAFRPLNLCNGLLHNLRLGASLAVPLYLPR